MNKPVFVKTGNYSEALEALRMGKLVSKSIGDGFHQFAVMFQGKFYIREYKGMTGSVSFQRFELDEEYGYTYSIYENNIKEMDNPIDINIFYGQ